MRWFIVDVKGGAFSVRSLAALGERPDDANEATGDPYRPWYQEREHVHMPPDDELGAHVLAQDELGAIARAKQLLGM